jgi:hypothetical protein
LTLLSVLICKIGILRIHQINKKETKSRKNSFFAPGKVADNKDDNNTDENEGQVQLTGPGSPATRMREPDRKGNMSILGLLHIYMLRKEAYSVTKVQFFFTLTVRKYGTVSLRRDDSLG